MSVEEILEAEDIVRTSEDLRSWKRKKLRTYFGSKRSGRIVLSRLFKSVIWQVYEKIRDGDIHPISGNLRTFWYRYVKVVLSHVPRKDQGKINHYDLMIRLFAELVTERQLFRYRDFGFVDENEANRRIGPTSPQILVFAEKRGWAPYLREVHETYGCSTAALGGFPSALSSEYLFDALESAFSPASTQALSLIGIVDYDPSGHAIASAFRTQLEENGAHVQEMTLLIDPKHYSEEEKAMFRYRLPRAQSTKSKQWFVETGGVDGKAYGLESESMPLERVGALLHDALEQKRT